MKPSEVYLQDKNGEIVRLIEGIMTQMRGKYKNIGFLISQMLLLITAIILIILNVILNISIYLPVLTLFIGEIAVLLIMSSSNKKSS